MLAGGQGMWRHTQDLVADPQEKPLKRQTPTADAKRRRKEQFPSRERWLSWKHMATVNAAAESGLVRDASSARVGSHVLIAMGVAFACTLLLTLLMTVEQLSMSLGDQTPRV